MTVNFADKAILGLAALPIMRDLGLNHVEFGLVGTSFFTFFSLSAVCVGILANHLPTKWILFAMALSWALIQLPMGLPLGAAALVANRVLLGLGEGPAYPVAVHATYKWFSADRRSFPTSFLNVGSAVGTGLAAPALVYVILHYSWHAAFATLGVVGLIWCLAWLVIGKEGTIADVPPVSRSSDARPVPYRAILTSRTFVAQAATEFASYWLAMLSVVWLPAYLVRGAGFSAVATGWIVTLPAIAQIVLVPGVSGFAQWLQARGASNRVACGWVSGASLFVSAAATVALPLVPGHLLPILCTLVAFSSGGIVFTLCPIMVASITPTAQRGLTLATGNAVATLAGVLAPTVMGIIIDSGTNTIEGFRSGFVMTGLAAAAVAILVTFLIDPEADAARLGRMDTAADGFLAGELAVVRNDPTH
ncbi:MAG TPA: MFS transporter [Rhodopila sp.]|uniref:MFS transporter n=1 Tax=Rhodopila sp. TaxID=2480087 RepID=UPI002CD6C206|nr:MFS transporter [Rhodopila sp.]HVY18396.1 MFS transporter [Rhodopila sp.]